MFAAQWALRLLVVFAILVAANTKREQTLAASHTRLAQRVGNPDAPPVGDLSCIASQRLNRSLVSSAARYHSMQRSG